jgi:hypothetical protein
MVGPHVNSGGLGRTPRWADSERLGRTTRLALVVLALGLVGLLGLARGLVPDPRGYGTHRQLGLASCGFLRLTGRPCPTCGMTTAFAWSVRGRLDRAWWANPAGAVLAPTCLALVPWLLVSAIRGRPWGTRSLDGPLMALVLASAALSVLAWTVRVLLEPLTR